VPAPGGQVHEDGRPVRDRCHPLKSSSAPLVTGVLQFVPLHDQFAPVLPRISRTFTAAAQNYHPSHHAHHTTSAGTNHEVLELAIANVVNPFHYFHVRVTSQRAYTRTQTYALPLSFSFFFSKFEKKKRPSCDKITRETSEASGCCVSSYTSALVARQ
jgi:hypothetical protein